MELDLACRGEILCSVQEQMSSAETPIQTVIEYGHNLEKEVPHYYHIYLTGMSTMDNQMSMTNR
jgi:hypothetical protein